MHEWIGHTTLHPLGLAAVIVLGLAMVLVPRRFAVAPLVIMACFIAPAQRVVILGANFDLMRIMILFGWARLVLRGELVRGIWSGVDTAVAAWMVWSTTAYVLRVGEPSALVSMLGWMLELGGAYFLLRQLIRGWEDVIWTMAAFCIVAVPVAAAFMVERASGRNPFAFFGGVPEQTMIREGRLRCQGAFAHPITAGCFWAALMPFMAALSWRGRALKTLVIVGIGGSLVIIVNTASSTPVMGILFAILGGAMFAVRKYVRAIWWLFLLALPCLHVGMNKPVWHLLARVDIVSGSTGYHRYLLIDAAVNHIAEWWALGVADTEHWGEGLGDITNHYLFEGVNGGLLGMIAFITVLRMAFKQIGVAWRCATTKEDRVMSWAAGVSLFVHATSFLAVAYFGQIYLVLMMSLAIAAGAPVFCRGTREGAEIRDVAVVPASGVFFGTKTAVAR